MEDLISYKMSSFVAIGKYISITIDIILSYMCQQKIKPTENYYQHAW